VHGSEHDGDRVANNNDRILRALQHAGELGVVPSDWVDCTPDGGPPILRLAAVIYRLRERGHHIDSSRRRRGSGQAVYILRPRRENGPRPS
jgi:hypothetical protein